MVNQSPEVKKKIRLAMTEISASMTRIEAERELIKEIIKKIADEHTLSKKLLAKLAKSYHKQSFSKDVEEQDEFQTMYETTFMAQN